MARPPTQVPVLDDVQGSPLDRLLYSRPVYPAHVACYCIYIGGGTSIKEDHRCQDMDAV